MNNLHICINCSLVGRPRHPHAVPPGLSGSGKGCVMPGVTGFTGLGFQMKRVRVSQLNLRRSHLPQTGRFSSHLRLTPTHCAQPVLDRVRRLMLPPDLLWDIFRFAMAAFSVDRSISVSSSLRGAIACKRGRIRRGAERLDREQES